MRSHPRFSSTIGVRANTPNTPKHRAFANQGLPTKAYDPFAPCPFWLCDPPPLLGDVGHLYRLTGSADAAYLPDAQREASKMPIEPVPFRLIGYPRTPGTGDQVQARGLIRTLRPHPARITDVPGFSQPDAC